MNMFDVADFDFLRDVVELKELDVSLVRTGPLMMERTASRRPTRQRTPTTATTQSKEPSSTITSQDGSPTARQSHRDELVSSPSPLFTPPNPRLSPLPPLLEDASSTSPPLYPSPAERRALSHEESISDSRFTFCSVPPSGSPPGLPVRSPRLKALSSTILAPPSPLTLSSPLFPRSPSPKPSSRPVSPIPLYLHPRSGSMSPLFKRQSTSESPKPLIFPPLTRRASVPDELTLEAEKGQSTGRDSPSPKWKPLGLAGVDANSSSPSLISGKSALASSTVAHSVRPWKGRSLVGWELKRNGNGSGKLGFGLVRKGGTGA
jgi:hypothetical protein